MSPLEPRQFRPEDRFDRIVCRGDADGARGFLEFGARRLAVRAIPASDPDTVARVSREFLRKYQPSSHAQEMVRSEILPTTLRLEPH
jgi:hypothetical protein